MKFRPILVAWVLVALVLVIGLIYELNQWRSIGAQRSRLALERGTLETQVRAQDEEIRREERSHSDLLRDLQWSANRGDPTAFLNGLAEFAQGARLKIVAIGPLEREAVTQFNKSWHLVQVVGPYREFKDLATRIEKEGGILEDVTLETAKPIGQIPSDEIEAKMRLTTIELKPQAKAILQRTVSAGQTPATPGAPGQPSLALSVPPSRETPGLAVRDPFAFAVTPPVAVASAGPRGTGGKPAAKPVGEAAEPPLPPMEVKGIVKFPGGHLAIVNNQIVQVGDSVSGYRIEQISDTTVTVRAPRGSARSLALPTIIAPPPAAVTR